tara:strand:- start:3853 stop:3999 length:147 start_codon:yes stop_codon:yes gene_type:complete
MVISEFCACSENSLAKEEEDCDLTPTGFTFRINNGAGTFCLTLLSLLS